MTSITSLSESSYIYTSAPFATQTMTSVLLLTSSQFPSPSPAACNDGSANLVGNLTSGEGSIEVCQDGSWYQVCDEGWSQEDATVACKSLGYSELGKLGMLQIPLTFFTLFHFHYAQLGEMPMDHPCMETLANPLDSQTFSAMVERQIWETAPVPPHCQAHVTLIH